MVARTCISRLIYMRINILDNHAIESEYLVDRLKLESYNHQNDNQKTTFDSDLFI